MPVVRKMMHSISITKLIAVSGWVGLEWVRVGLIVITRS